MADHPKNSEHTFSHAAQSRETPVISFPGLVGRLDHA